MSDEQRQVGAVTVVANPVAGEGHGLELAEAFATALENQVRTVHVVITEGDGDAARLLGDACDAGVALVVAVGGDGSVQEAVDVIARRER